MSLPPGTPITNQIAHDICVRDAAAATIGGSIASLGKSYVVTLQAITCPDGVTLAREQIQADDKEHVLQRSRNRRDGHARQARRIAQLDPEVESSTG